MRKWKVAFAVGILISLMAGAASAQFRRGRAYRNGQYGSGGQYGQYGPGGYGQGYNAGPQYQQARGQATEPRYYARRVPGQMPGGASPDQQLASWLLVDNRGEIELAKLARERASCDDVKEFAKKLFDDHSKFVEDLQAFAGGGRGMREEPLDYQAANEQGRVSQPPNGRNEPPFRRPYAAAPGGAQAGGPPQGGPRGPQQGGPAMGGLNFVRLKQQLGQQCVASAERELEHKKGDEFDKCYIGMQLAKHMEMLDTLKVFSRYASPQLDELIEEAEQTTQEHFDQAKDLIKQLENGEEEK